MSASGWVHLDVELIRRETENALLLQLEEDSQLVWIPKSQIRNPDELAVGDENCTVDVTEWIAEQKGLEES